MFSRKSFGSRSFDAGSFAGALLAAEDGVGPDSDSHAIAAGKAGRRLYEALVSDVQAPPGTVRVDAKPLPQPAAERRPVPAAMRPGVGLDLAVPAPAATARRALDESAEEEAVILALLGIHVPRAPSERQDEEDMAALLLHATLH